MPVPAPWARPGSGFTLLFEAWAVEMARHLPVSTLAEQLDETDTRLWRSVAHYVDEARRLEDYMGVEPSASTRPAAGAAIASPWSPISWSTMSST